MSRQVTNKNKMSQHDGKSRKKKPIDDSDKITLDNNACIFPESKVEAIQNSQSSLNICKDLFGECIPQTSSVYISNSQSENISYKNKMDLKRKKLPHKGFVVSPVRIPEKMSLSIPESTKIMKNSQSEFHSLININENSNNVSIISNNSLDISGIQSIIECPTPITSKAMNNENNIEPSSILKGVSAFVDYKVDDDNSGKDIVFQLINLGAKIEKTFNRKVTHVVFCDGCYITYKKATERKIPLVSAMWVNNCKLANKILDTVDYPPIGTEKYTKMQEKKEDHHLRKSKRIRSIKKEQLFDDKVKKEELLQTSKKDTVKSCIPIDYISLIKEPLCIYLNTKEDDEELIEDYGPPLSVIVLRKVLTPNSISKTSTTEINTNLVKIEDRLKLSSKKRKRLRKLLFPLNKELLKMNIKKPQNLIVNSLPDQEKQIVALDTGNSSTSSYTPDNLNAQVLQTIACTGLSNSERNKIKMCLQQLGSFDFHAKLKSSTTYLVIKNVPEKKSKKTELDLVFAMAFGCYIISQDWILQSYKKGGWLPQKKFLFSKLSKPVKDFQKRRHSNESSSKLQIFNNVGKIYISKSCKPSSKQLKKLVHVCGGKCTNFLNKASVVIGGTEQMIYNNIQEKWILDCIIKGKLISKFQYKLTNNNIA